jgi:hypothetical protein
VKLNKHQKKSDQGMKRNCVFPKLLENPNNTGNSATDLMSINVITEYYGGDTHTGFIQLEVGKSNYDMMKIPNGLYKPYEEKRIDDIAFRFTSANCPTMDEWYAFGAYTVGANDINVVVYFNWNDSAATYWPVGTYPTGQGNIHSIILSTQTDPLISGQPPPNQPPAGFPVTGYYVGGATSISHCSLCDQPAFGKTPT